MWTTLLCSYLFNIFIIANPSFPMNSVNKNVYISGKLINKGLTSFCAINSPYKKRWEMWKQLHMLSLQLMNISEHWGIYYIQSLFCKYSCEKLEPFILSGHYLLSIWSDLFQLPPWHCQWQWWQVMVIPVHHVPSAQSEIILIFCKTFSSGSLSVYYSHFHMPSSFSYITGTSDPHRSWL